MKEVKMKNRIKLIGIFFILSIVGLNATQTPYYIYNKGERMYLQLNTKFAFLSLPTQDIPSNISERNVRISPMKSDNSSIKHYQGEYRSDRYYVTLTFEDDLSKEDYLSRLSSIKSQNENIIISPFFRHEKLETIGLSNFYYVKLKQESDSTLLRQMADQIGSIILEQIHFLPL